MSGLLRLANDFIERMMNPAFGPLVNDDYSALFGELVGDGEGLNRILEEARLVGRVDELSTYTWAWLLTTPGSETMLSRDLLLELCQQFQAPAFRVTVIDCAMRGRPRLRPDEELLFDRAWALEEIEDPWLAGLVRSAVPPETQLQGYPDISSADRPSMAEPRSYSDTQSLLVALLTADWRECQEAAVALLHHEWAGQEALLAFFESRTTAMDEESRSRWLRMMPAGWR